jgi:hypothetical protein
LSPLLLRIETPISLIDCGGAILHILLIQKVGSLFVLCKLIVSRWLHSEGELDNTYILFIAAKAKTGKTSVK